MTETSIDDLIESAEEKKEKYSEAQKEAREVKEKLRESIKELRDQDEISQSEFMDLKKDIDSAKYGKVRERINEVLNELDFDDEEKDLFAQRFSDSFQELEETVETIRNDLVALRYDESDRETLIATIYGKHSGLNKGDIRDVFDTVEDVSETGLSDDDLARILSKFNSGLKKKNARKIVDAIREESS